MTTETSGSKSTGSRLHPSDPQAPLERTLELMRSFRVTRLKTSELEVEMAHVIGPEQGGVSDRSFQSMTGIDPEENPKLAAMLVDFAAKLVESASEEDNYPD